MVPKPLPDELLSSWLIRIAIKHQTQPTTFMNMHFPEIKPNFWSRDVDVFWGAKPDFLKKLSYKSHLSIDTLYKMTLQSYTGFLAEKIHINTRNKFLTPIKNRGRYSQSVGLRFCPLCLAEDKEPYFRKYWRLSFVTLCPRHECFLENCCPSCNLPTTPYKVKQSNDFCKCHYCGASLLDHDPIFNSRNQHGLDAQKNLFKILNTGLFTFEGNSYYSLAYFEAFKQMNKIIYSFIFRKDKLIKTHEIFLKDYPLSSPTKNTSVYLEDIPVKEQFLIYSISEYVLQSFEKANLFCKKNNIGKTELTHSMANIPYWYDLIIRQNDHSQYSISLSEAISALHYLKKHGSSISFKSLSILTGYALEKRKRPDIAIYISTI